MSSFWKRLQEYRSFAWSAIISDIKANTTHLDPDMQYGQLHFATLGARGLSGLSDFLYESADPPGNYHGLTPNISDAAYLYAFRYFLSETDREAIAKLNTPIANNTTIQKTIDRLLSHPGALSDYISQSADLFRDRLAREYNYLLGLRGLPIYPYKYLTDYVDNNFAPAAPQTTPLKVEFIYCIKNRVQRTTLSLRSLDAAYSHYINNGGNRLSISATVSEDTSADILATDKLTLGALPIKHYLLDTGIGWTRSGLLNYGIKRSDADILAFVDADFLFHQSFVAGLDRALRDIDVSKNAIAVNLIETETHEKDARIYSKGSPYSYMWMSSRRIAAEITGFDEGYSGHGFEDRDFEMKLTRLGGLRICDTISIDPECFVLHLSHHVRTGDDKRTDNKERYLKRQAEPPHALQQERWGEFPIIHHRQCEPALNIAASVKHRTTIREVDFLFLPHNEYHARTFLRLHDMLRQRGYSAALVNISPPHPNESAYIPNRPEAYIALSDVMTNAVSARAIACMNDWEGKVTRRLVDCANAHNVPTIAIVEGVNDFHDVDTGSDRKAYRRARHLLLNGSFDKKYFKNSDQSIRVCGIQRLDPLMSRSRRPTGAKKPVALVNVNFSYGVLRQHRDQWLAQIAEACEKNGYEMVTSQHHADDADLTTYNRSSRPLYDLLEECDVFISRFSGAILEALALGVNVIYYNTGFEKVDKFFNPLGAYIFAKDQGSLELALQYFCFGAKLDASAFLQAHCDIEPDSEANALQKSSTEKTVDSLIAIAKNSHYSVNKFSETTRDFYAQFLTKGGFGPRAADMSRSDDDFIKNTTFGIKSFGRSFHLTQLVSSILGKYPRAKILVCDDSIEGPGTLPDCVKLIRPKDSDIGLSAGRNLLLDNCDTEYFVLLDDDFIFTKKTETLTLLRALEFYDLDIAGGVVYDVGPSAQKKDQPRTFFGCIDISSNQQLTISTGRARDWNNNLPVYDLVLNFFACRTKVIRDLRWTESLKLGEHLDFFLRAKEAGLKISYFPEVVVDHYRNHSANSEDYKAYRLRADEYHQRFKDMYSISKIFLNNDEIPG